MTAKDTPAPLPRKQLDLSTVQNVLEGQARTLEALKGAALGSMGGQLAKALPLIETCKGRVLVSGGDEAMALARLFAARLSTTGTPSFALNPMEALQGNVGMVGSDDVMIMLCDSGESPALVSLIDQLKKRSQPLIAITSAKASALARTADVAICYPRATAKGRTTPENLQLIQMHCLCEAMVTAIASSKIEATEALNLLPLLGTLGAQLCYVSDVMLKADRLALVDNDTPIKLVLEAFLSKGCPYVGVVDDNGQFAGLIDQEALRSSALMTDSAKTANDIMMAAQLCFSPETLASSAVYSLSKSGLPAAFVLEGGRPIGLVLLPILLKAMGGRRA